MYSQCPECQTRFRVTAGALRAAHGTVRCGRCGSAFDALQSLTDSLDDGASSASRAASPLATFIAASDDVASNDSLLRDGIRDDAVVTEFHFSPDDIEQVFVDARDWQRQFGIGGERLPATEGEDVRDGTQSAEAAGASSRSAGVPEEDVYVHEPEAVEDITLEGERIVIESLPELDDDLRQIGAEDELHDGRDDAVRLDGAPAVAAPVDLDSTDRFEVLRDVPESQYPELEEDEPRVRSSNVPPFTEADEGAGSPAPVENAVEAVPPQEHVEVEDLAATPTPAPPPIVPFRLRDRAGSLEESIDEDATTEDRGHALRWSVGSLVLAIALLAQLTNYYRHDLARDARLGPIVRSVYAGLGQPLAPNWDLAAFELRQWGASEPAPTESGVMTVRASLRNGADFAQPMPLLRVELEDRFGNPVARRDFQPGEYLKDPAQATRLLGPGAKTEAELALVEVNAEAVGYRLDVCLRDEAQGVRCAQSATPDAGPQ